jgi:hypothetical protein
MATEFVDKQWRIPNSWNVDQSNQGKISNYSMKFNNVSTNFIEFPETDFLKSGQASFSFWSNPNTYGGNNYGYFFSGSLQTDGGLAMSEGGTGGGTYTPGVLYWYNGSASIILNVTLTENVWNHVVIVFDGTTITTYKDGSNPVTTTITAPAALKFNTIGKYSPANSNILNGELDQVCVFDYALSESQVSTLYGNSSAGYFQIGNPMALTPNPVVFYPLGDQDVQQTVDSTDWRIPNHVATGGDVFQSVPLRTTNTVPTDTITSSINYNGTPGLPDPFTVSFWMKDSFVGNGSVFFDHDASTYTTATPKGAFVYFAGGRVLIYLKDNFWRYYSLPAGVVLTDNDWRNIVVYVDPTNITLGKVWIDGTLLGLSSGNGNGAAGSDFTAGFRFYLNNFGSNVMYFKDYEIDNAGATLLYNNGAPLLDTSTLAQAPDHWWKLNASDTFDTATSTWTIKDHVGSENGTSVNMDASNLVSSELPNTGGRQGYSPWAIDLDGIDDNFTIDNSSKDLNTENISISTWFFQDDSAAASSFPAIIINGFSGSGGSYWGLVMRPGNIVSAQLRLLDINGNLTFIMEDITQTITTDQWNHIAMTYDGTTLKGYINGVEETLSLSGASGKIQYATTGMNSQDLLIGKRGTDSFRIDGKISNFAIWGSGLTSTQIATIYNNGIPGDISSLNPLAWWELGIMTGFNSGTWTAISNSDSNFTAVSTANMTESDLVNGPGYSTNATGTSTLVLEKQAPYSFNNALSENMAISNRDDSQVSDPYPLMIELDLTGETSSYTFTAPILYTSGDVSIDWGDGSAIQQTGTISNSRLTHVYDTDTYPRPLIQWGRSTDAGKISRFLVNAAGSRLNISNLKQWGKSFNGIQINFNNAANMIITAQDIPDFSSLTSMASMFLRCNSMTTIPNIEKWDVSNKALSASQMFRFCQKFIATDLDNFADNVFTSQSAMFGNCTSLNSASFSKWRTRGAMSETFEFMSSLDQDLSTKTVTRADGSTYIAWDISECTSLFQLLDYNSGFTGTNPNISNWDTSNIVGSGFGYLFLQAKMNSDISTKQISTPNPYNNTYTAWDVSGVTNFISLMQSNSIFNQNLRTWQLNESTTTLNQIFTSTAAFSDDNYTDTLVGWAVYLYGVENPPESLSLGNTSGLNFQSNRTVNSDDNGSTTTNYSSLYPSWPETWTQAGDARDYLVETLGWSSTGTPL